jgi:hypothetical protein
MGPWTDTSLPLAERVESLLNEMTLDEKRAQLGSVWIGAQLSSAPRTSAGCSRVASSRAR